MAKTERGRNIREIIVHCTATKEGRHVTVEEVDRWHKQQGWAGIGYHYLVYLDGSIHMGRPEQTIGAHCLNHNRNSIGVCYVGGLDREGNPKDTRTPEQKASLRKLLRLLKKKHPGSTIHGHREFARKDCPCFDAHTEYLNIMLDKD